MSEDKKLENMKLSDDELESVGGAGSIHQYMDFGCECGGIFKVDVAKDKAVCPYCGKIHYLLG